MSSIQPQEVLEVNSENMTDKPSMFQVLLHNDNYTTMEFVVFILMSIFRKNEEQATQIMLAVHKRGVGIAGVYPLEIAETKVEQTRIKAKEASFPLHCSLEEVL